jgi:MFS family permease
MGIATLIFASVAGWVIRAGNTGQANALLGYQLAFVLAFVAGMASTYSFSRIPEPRTRSMRRTFVSAVSLRSALRSSPGYLGFVIFGVVWNFSLATCRPLFQRLSGHAAGRRRGHWSGIVTSISSLAALGGQLLFGRVMDRRGAVFLAVLTGFPIVVLPTLWMFYTEPWQVGVNNLFGGFLWAGFNLANFNLLLQLTPDEGRARAVALYQTGVFASAFVGPIVGGFLADNVGFELIFGLSGLGRLVGMAIFVAMTAWPLHKLRRAAAA